MPIGSSAWCRCDQLTLSELTCYGCGVRYKSIPAFLANLTAETFQKLAPS